MDWGPNPAIGGSYPRWAGNPRECKIRIWEERERERIQLNPPQTAWVSCISTRGRERVMLATRELASLWSQKKAMPTPTLRSRSRSASEISGGEWIRCASASSHPPSPLSNRFPFPFSSSPFLLGLEPDRDGGNCSCSVLE